MYQSTYRRILSLCMYQSTYRRILSLCMYQSTYRHILSLCMYQSTHRRILSLCMYQSTHRRILSLYMYQSTYRHILPSHVRVYLLLNLIYTQSNNFIISHRHIPFFLSNSLMSPISHTSVSQSIHISHRHIPFFLSSSLMSPISHTSVSQSIHITLFWKVTPCILKDVNLALKSVLLLVLRTKSQYVPSTCSIYQTARRDNPER
jgi:hypothetical protein